MLVLIVKLSISIRYTVGIAFYLGYAVLRFNYQLLAVFDHSLIQLLNFLQVFTKSYYIPDTTPALCSQGQITSHLKVSHLRDSQTSKISWKGSSLVQKHLVFLCFCLNAENIPNKFHGSNRNIIFSDKIHNERESLVFFIFFWFVCAFFYCFIA